MINLPASNKADPTREYVAGWVRAAVWAMLQALPRYSSDVDRDFGHTVYTRMLNDGDVEGAVGTLTDSVLSEGADLAPSVAKPETGDDAEYQAAVAALDVCKVALDGVDLEQVCDDLLDALLYGYVVLEKTYRPEGGRWVVESVANKPRENTLLVVNPANRVVGVLGVSIDDPGQRTVTTGVVPDPSLVIPASKFVVASWRPKQGDPRGRSILRPAYNPWFAKATVWPSLVQYLLRFGQPSVLGKAPAMQGATDFVGGDGTTASYGTPVKAFVDAIQQFFENGSYMVVSADADVELLEPRSNGEAMREGLAILKSEITYAILRQTRSTREAEHGSKADSQTGLTIQDRLVRRVRRWVAGVLRRQLLAEIVEFHLGPEAVPYAPIVNLEGMGETDFAAQANAIAELTRAGYLHTSQFQALDERLGLPARDMDAMLAEAEADRAFREDMAREGRRLMEPGPEPGDEDDEDDEAEE